MAGAAGEMPMKEQLECVQPQDMWVLDSPVIRSQV